MTRCLVTGAGGFLGHHALRHFLAETDWHIVATDSFRHEGKTDRIALALDGAPAEWRHRVTVITHDGLDPRKLADLGWKPPVPFGESLERTVAWTLSHPEWLLR